MRRQEHKYNHTPNFENSTLRWVKYQSHQIDCLGFDKWYNETDGPTGPSEQVNSRANPFFYRFDMNMTSFYDT